MREVIERRDQRPAVHLALVDLLRSVIEAGRISKPDGIGRGENPKMRVGNDDLVLVEESQASVEFKNSLDDEHHIRSTRVVFVENQRRLVPQRPWQDSFLEFSDLLSVPYLDRVLADQVDPGNMAVQVHPRAWPAKSRGDLFDVRGFSGSVIALNHHAPIVREPGEDRQGRVRIEFVGGVNFGHAI